MALAHTHTHKKRKTKRLHSFLAECILGRQEKKVLKILVTPEKQKDYPQLFRTGQRSQGPFNYQSLVGNLWPLVEDFLVWSPPPATLYKILLSFIRYFPLKVKASAISSRASECLSRDCILLRKMKVSPQAFHMGLPYPCSPQGKNNLQECGPVWLTQVLHNLISWSAFTSNYN